MNISVFLLLFAALFLVGKGGNGENGGKGGKGKGGNGGGRNSGSSPSNILKYNQKGVSTGPGQPVAVEKGPCHDIKCKGLFQVPVPPSCECRCPGPADQASCPPAKTFDDNICECVCRDINFNCFGNADFDFDECNCVCRLHQGDCGPQERVDPTRCLCVDIPPPPPPPPPACTLQCRGTNQYLDGEKCQCKCRKFLVKKTYRHGRSLYEENDFEDQLEDNFEEQLEDDFEQQLEDELQHKRSLSRKGFRNSQRRFGSRIGKPRVSKPRIAKPRISKPRTGIFSKPRTGIFSKPRPGIFSKPHVSKTGTVTPRISKPRTGIVSKPRTGTFSKPSIGTNSKPRIAVPEPRVTVKPVYSQSCPAGKRVDYNTCVCYW